MDEKDLLEISVKVFLENIKNKYQDLKDELKQLSQTDLQEYFNKQIENYSYIKTILHGSNPVLLHRIYFPLNIRFDYRSIEAQNIQLVFSSTNYVALIGEAGCGKSTLMKYLFLTCIKQQQLIPVFVELRYLNEYKGSIFKYITNKIFHNKIAQNGKILERLLNKGIFIFFLDGADELNLKVKNSAAIKLQQFVDTYPKNKFLLSTRPYSNFEYLPKFLTCEVMLLQQADFKPFIEKQITEKELIHKILKSIKRNKDPHILSFLRNPLLLSIYILTFEQNSQIPQKRNLFYRRIIDALFIRHDSISKLAFKRERISHLSDEQIEIILQRFAFISFFERKFNFDIDYINRIFNKIKQKLYFKYENHELIEDLKLFIALWVEDEGTLSFAHRSLQEYFTVLFISNLDSGLQEMTCKKIMEQDSFITHEFHFLSLFEEMIPLTFYKYYSIPVMEEFLKEKYLNKSKEQIIIDWMKDLQRLTIFSEYGMESNQETYSDKLLKYKYVILYLDDFESAVDQLVQRIWKSNKQLIIEYCSTNNKYALNKYELFKNNPNLISIELYDVVKSIKINVDKIIEYQKNFIFKSVNADKDLIDMI